MASAAGAAGLLRRVLGRSSSRALWRSRYTGVAAECHSSVTTSSRRGLCCATVAAAYRPGFSWQGLVPSALHSNGVSSNSIRAPHIVHYARQYSAAADYPPHQELTMPSLSPTMEQGNIGTWKVKEGDKVSTGDVLAEIETDKATLDLENMEDGYIAKILAPDGSKDVPVGQPIAILVEDESDVGKFKDYSPSKSEAPSKPSAPEPGPSKQEQPTQPSSPPTPPQKEDESTSTKQAAPVSERLFASPLARKVASDMGVNLCDVKGSGPNGRIVKADVEAHAESAPAKDQAKPEAAAKAPKAAAPGADFGDYEDIPVSQIKKITAQRLLQSKQTIPHYYLTSDCQMDALLKLRAELNAAQEKAGGKKLSVNDFVIKAASLALRKVPQVNGSWMNDFIRQYKNVDISVAVQTEQGLMVPVVKNADKLGLTAISNDVKRLADLARAGKLKPQDFSGGTFTVSNLGMYGVKQFCAIINPPQACILAVGATEKRVVAAKDGYASASFMAVTLSCDHRIVDGALGAQWLGAFKGYIEDPMTMLL
eukprot:jgi/Chlat1/544/Chrsp103S01122